MGSWWEEACRYPEQLLVVIQITEEELTRWDHWDWKSLSAWVKVLPKEFIAEKKGVRNGGMFGMGILAAKNQRWKHVRNTETSWLIAVRLGGKSNGLMGRGYSIWKVTLVVSAIICLWWSIPWTLMWSEEVLRAGDQRFIILTTGHSCRQIGINQPLTLRVGLSKSYFLHWFWVPCRDVQPYNIRRITPSLFEISTSTRPVWPYSFFCSFLEQKSQLRAHNFNFATPSHES